MTLSALLADDASLLSAALARTLAALPQTGTRAHGYESSKPHSAHKSNKPPLNKPPLNKPPLNQPLVEKPRLNGQRQPTKDGAAAKAAAAEGARVEFNETRGIFFFNTEVAGSRLTDVPVRSGSEQPQRLSPSLSHFTHMSHSHSSYTPPDVFVLLLLDSVNRGVRCHPRPRRLMGTPADTGKILTLVQIPTPMCYSCHFAPTL